MNKQGKKIALAFVALVLTISSFKAVSASSPAIPNVIYESKDSVNLGSGVRHEHIKKFTGSQWVNINIMRVDMQNEYTELKGLFNENGIPNRDTVSNMVDKSGAIGGINGDYFNYSPLPSSLGTLINDGEMISSPIERAYALPSFSISYDNKADVSYMDRSIILDNLKSKDRVVINTLNKVTANFDTPTLLDSNWGSKSVGNRFHKDLIEVLIQGDRVKDVRIGKPAVNIPKDGYVVAARGQRSQILRRFKIGDKVDLEVNTSPDIENIKFAIGAGSIILKDGQPMLTNIHSSGSHPRTGLAVNKDNTELMLVTLDGRSHRHHGIGQKEFGKLLKELGAHHGVNLDGGGSTTMAIKYPNRDKSTVVNKPSSGSQRPVVNGVGVFTKAPKGQLDHIEVNCSEAKMHANTRRNISIAGYDAYRNRVPIDRSLLDITIEGVEGELENAHVFKPTSPGRAKISVDYKGFKDSETIRVYDEVKNLYIKGQPIKIEANREYRMPQIFGQDRNGSSARLYLADLDIELTAGVGKLEGGLLETNGAPKSGYVIYRHGDNLEKLRLVSQLGDDPSLEIPESTKLEDPLENSFDRNPDMIVGTNTINLSKDKQAKYNSIINSSGKFLSLNNFYGNWDKDLTTELIWAGGYYGVHKSDKTYIVCLDSKNGGISPSNSYQWTRLQNEIMNRPEKNIIISSQKPLWGEWSFHDNDESLVLHDLLSRMAEKGKNVFLVHGGFSNGVELKDGVRYLGLNVKAEKNQEQINDLSLIEFYLNGEDLNYRLRKLDDKTPEIKPPNPELADREEEDEIIEKTSLLMIGSNTINLDDNRQTIYNKQIAASHNFLSLNNFYAAWNEQLASDLIWAGSYYRASQLPGTYIASIDSKSGSISASDPSQWDKLEDEVMNRSEKNIIITSQKPLWGEWSFEDPAEADRLHNLLIEIKDQGKNVFVVHGGFSNEDSLKDDIRYIGLNVIAEKNPEDIERISLVEFNLDGEDLIYNIKEVFK